MISIDPGTDVVGVAWWWPDTLELAAAHSVDVHDESLTDAMCWVDVAQKVRTAVMAGPFQVGPVVYENPQLIKGWQKGDQNAIILLAGATGAICRELADLAPLIAVRPSQWTRGKGKTPNHIKMWKRLSAYEREKLASSFNMPERVLETCIQHGDEAQLEHAMDAVCVGLYHLGRFEKY